MSEESLAVVREMNVAFNRGNGRWLEFYAPDAEFVMPPEWPEEPVHRGRESIAGLLSKLTAVFGAQHWHIERLIDAGDECVIVLARAHGKVQGKDIDQRIAAVQYVQAGQVVRQLTFFSWEEAAEMERAGMAMGSHSHSHPILAGLSAAEQSAGASEPDDD